MNYVLRFYKNNTLYIWKCFWEIPQEKGEHPWSTVSRTPLVYSQRTLTTTFHVWSLGCTHTFLNLVTEKVDFFSSGYTPCCSVHPYDFQVRCIGGLCPQGENNAHPRLALVSQSSTDELTPTAFTKTQTEQEELPVSSEHFLGLGLGLGHSLSPSRWGVDGGICFPGWWRLVPLTHKLIQKKGFLRFSELPGQWLASC